MPRCKPGNAPAARIQATEAKRTFAKPINISAGAAGPRTLHPVRPLHLVLRPDRRRPFIDMQERGALQQVGIYADEPFESYLATR